MLRGADMNMMNDKRNLEGRKEGRTERKGVTLETAEPDTTGYALTGGRCHDCVKLGWGGDEERSSFVGKILGVFPPLAV